MKRLIPILLVIMMSTLLVQNRAEAQILSTKLKITVVDALGNVVQDAKVRIFKNKADYTKEVNDVQPFKLTNAKGQVTFKKLKAVSYYIIVEKVGNTLKLNTKSYSTGSYGNKHKNYKWTR